MKRRIAGATALAVALSLGMPPEVVPEHGGWPISGLLSLFEQAPSFAAVTGLPVRDAGTGADETDHYVSADQTRANGGAGEAPDPGMGQDDPALPDHATQKASETSEKPAGEHSFDEKTSKLLPKRSSGKVSTYENADGSITKEVHKARVNYRVADGSYQPIETDLVERDDRLEMGANSIDVSLAPSTGSAASKAAAAAATAAGSTAAAGPLASVSTASGYTMSYRLAGAADVAAVVDGSTATYPEVLPGTDLELRTINDGLKETLILKSPAAGNEWVFPLELSGLTPTLTSDGSIDLTAPDGSVAMVIPAGYMEDAKVDPKSGAPAQSTAVEYELVTVDGGPALKVTADAAWLNDPAREYPVRVDPSTLDTVDTGDVFADNSDDTVNQNGDNLPVGTWNGGTTKSRSFLHFDKFDDDDLTGTQIKSATLWLWHTWSYDCSSHEPFYVRRINEPWTVAGLADNGKLAEGPEYSAPIGTKTITNNKPACENTAANRGEGEWRTVSMDTTTFNGWSSGAIPNYGLALTASESDSTAFKRFTSANYGDLDPYLELTYDNNEYPQVNEQYPAYGATAPTLTPELIADATDPDGWPHTLTYEFFVYSQDAKTQIATSGVIKKKSWKIPAGVLSWGENYYWTVKVSDGLLNNGKYLTKHLLATPVPQPSITSTLSQNGDQGFDPVAGNYTTSARDAMITTVGPALEIARSYNSNDPRSSQAFGAGWSSIADTKAVARTAKKSNGDEFVNTVVVTYPTGREQAFGRNNDGTYGSPSGYSSNFSAISGGGWRLIEKDGTTYEFAQKVVEDSEYALSAIKDVAGRTETFTYTGGRLTRITAASGRTLTLTWTGTTPNHVASVSTDPATPGDASTVNTWTYTYDGDALTTVCPPTSTTECHKYTYTTGPVYQTAVANARPQSYWRLNETSFLPITGLPTTANSSVLENAGTDNGSYRYVSLGQPGPVAGSSSKAAGFNGTSSRVQLPADLKLDAANQAISLWFNATAGDGGVLYGQSWESADYSSSETTTGAYNPTLYIGTDGKLKGTFPKAPKPGTAIGSLVASGQGQCITVPGNVSTTGVRLALADCTGAANQQWTWTTDRELRVTTGGAVRCMDAKGNDAVNGVDLISYTCNGGANQQWDVQADGQIVGGGSGLCVDSVGTGTLFDTEAELQIWACGKQRQADQSFLPEVHDPMSSTTVVTDGEWHHVVLSSSGNTQQMYLDGNTKPVASETGVTVQDMSAASSFLGQGYLGGDWPNQPHSDGLSNIGTLDHYTGSIAEVAVFDTAVGPQLVADLKAAEAPVSRMKEIVRPSGGTSAAITYSTVTGRVTKVTDGNGSVWEPVSPTVVGTTKVAESAVLGGAPTNYWRMAETGASDAVNQVNGGTATYNLVGIGEVTGPFGGDTTAGSFGHGSYLDLPSGVLPTGTGSVSMWFNVDPDMPSGGVLLGEAPDAAASAIRPIMPTLWVGDSGYLHGATSSFTPTGPINSSLGAKCLDVQGGDTANGTPIQLYTCNGSVAQTWTLALGTSGTTGTVHAVGKCLDVKGGGTTSGTAVQLYTCNGSDAQIWQPYSYDSLRNPNSGMCLTVPSDKRTSTAAPQSGLNATSVTSDDIEEGTDLVIETCTDKDPASGWQFGLMSSKAVNDGAWHHVALTTSGTTQTLYLDGQKVQSSTGTAFLPFTTDYYVGAGNSTTTWVDLEGPDDVWYFNGDLAETAFYGSALEPAQVSYQYKARDAVKAAASGEIKYAVNGPAGTQTATINDLMYSRKVAEVDALGNTTRYGYSGKGHLRTVTDPLGNMTINEHDVRGNVVAATTCQDRSENKCSTTFSSYYPDATTEKPAFSVLNDRLLEQRGPGSSSATDDTYLTTYTYDALGNRTSETDPLGRKTTISYTDGTTTGGYLGGTAPAGLPWRLVKPGGGMQTILYYASGDIAQTTDPAGMVTRYEYDGLGRTVKEIDVVAGADGATTGYQHDRLDRVVRVTDPATTNAVSGAKHTPVTTLTYNADGLQTAETVSDATGEDASRTVSYEYDDRGRRTAEIDELGNRVTLGYDAFGRVSRQEHADGSVVETVYDAVGNELKTVVKDWTGDPNDPSEAQDLIVRSLAYDAAGRLATETDAENVVTEYTYTDNNLLVSVTRRDPDTGESFVMEMNTYDAAGNVTTEVTNNGRSKTTRTYDKVGRNLTAKLDLDELSGESAGARDRTTAYGYSLEDDVVSTILYEGGTAIASSETAYDRLGRVQQQTSYLTTGLTPTLRWKLDETTGTTSADAVGNNPGTTSGAVTRSTERSGAAVFSGAAGWISAPQAPVDTLRPYTVSTWVNLAAEDADRTVLALPGDLGGPALQVLYNKKADTYQVATTVRKSNGDTETLTGTTSGTVASGTWTHLAVVVDPASTTRTATIYLGGTAAGSLSTAKDLNNRATGLLIGAASTDIPGDGYFSGSVDDVQTYQKALTAAEIAALVAGTAPTTANKVSRISNTLTADGSATATTDPRGNITYFGLDAVGRTVQTTTPAVSAVVGQGTEVTSVSNSLIGYNTFGEITEEQDPHGNITVARYDGDGNLVENTSPALTVGGVKTGVIATTRAEYDEVGQIAKTIDPLDNETVYEYDQLGRTSKITAPDTGVTKYGYDLLGNVISHTDPNGARVVSEYDYLGRTLTSGQVVRGTTVSPTNKDVYTYGDSPWPTKVTSAAGVVTSATYNNAGEPVTTTDGAGNVTTTNFDGAGRAIKVINPDNSYSTVAYDLGGRLLAAADYSAAGVRQRRTSQDYDVAGNQTTSTDARGTIKTFVYNAVNQLTLQIEPISSSDTIVTRYRYDLAGRQTRFTDGRENNFITTYNSWGLPESQVEPATTATPSAADRTFTVSYDVAGRATKVSSPGGVTTTSEYDVMGRLTKSSGTGAQATTADKKYGYDLVGRMTSFTGSAGSSTVSYDDRGLVTSITGVSGSSSYGYNADGALTSRVDGAGTTTYTYEKGLLKKAENTTAGVSIAYSKYNTLNQVEQINYGGNVRNLGYNDLHQLTSDELKTSAGATVGKIAYEWNVNDSVTKKTTTGFNGASANTYTYDLADRLIGWDNGTTSTVYAYDKSGNRLQAGAKTFTYDQRNQLTAETSTGTTYTYTPRGTLKTTVTNGQTVATTTDAFNQVVTQGTKTGGISTYTYDGLGRVVQAGVTYTGLGNDVAADGTSAYVRDVAGDLVGVSSSAGKRYAWTDSHTDVVGEFTATGTALTGSVSYDPWGTILASGGMTGKLGYQQEWTDQGTGKVNMASRWYDPETGAFDTRDTANNSANPMSGAANRFAYAEGDPMSNTDTTGNGVDGGCGEYDYACALKKYQEQLAEYTSAMEQRDRDMKAAGSEIARQEAEYQRGERESNTSLLDILLQVGVGMLLDMIGYYAVVGCISGSIMDCVDLASNFIGPVKAARMGRTIWRAADKAFAGYRLWKRIVEGARTIMRRAQDLINVARKHLDDLMKKVPKKPKPPKKKRKPPAKKKPRPKRHYQSKPKASKQAQKPNPQTSPKRKEAPTTKAKPKANKASNDRPERRRSENNDTAEAGRPDANRPEAETPASCPIPHSFDPSTFVLMADGTTRPISEVNVGDRVLAKDPATGESGAREVTFLHSNHDVDLTEVTVSDKPADTATEDKAVNEGKGDRSTRGPTESTLSTTAHHPFWDATTGAWIDAADLVAGESTLVAPDGTTQYVTEVQNHTGAKVMRDLTVADIHTYYVLAGTTPVLVHNCDTPAPAMADRAIGPADANGVGPSQSLYHYTTEDGMNGIVGSGSMRPSLKANNPKDARYGDGQYLTTIGPGTKTGGQLSAAFIRVPWGARKFTHYVEIDATGLNIQYGRNGVLVHPSGSDLDLAGRIVSWGKN
ncbi:LamG-like jellyroll fold domain-containing protein [Actinoplanes sp. NPDC051851]|uniref:LamG-like jellyroll fold domain-containing protein n=1 Tax=Actinoplanes sp. NPDC051851 TaxID=3154753 RepID=UPI003417CA56